jgi:hypothetical protein
VIKDVLQRKLEWGDEGKRLAMTMAGLLFDDTSFPLPPTSEARVRAEYSLRTGDVHAHGYKTDFCSLYGQKHLVNAIQESGFNPFATFTIAEVGGIEKYGWRSSLQEGLPAREYFTITLGGAPITQLFC